MVKCLKLIVANPKCDGVDIKGDDVAYLDLQIHLESRAALGDEITGSSHFAAIEVLTFYETFY